MLRISRHYVNKKVAVLIIVELFVLAASTYLAASIKLTGTNSLFLSETNTFFLSACAFSAAMLLSMSALGMYQHNFAGGFRSTLLRLLPSFALGFGMISLFFYFQPDLFLGQEVVVLGVGIACLGIMLARGLFSKSSESKLLASRIIFLGGGALAKECMDFVVSHKDYHEEDIVGFIPMPNDECVVPKSAILPSDQSLMTLVQKYKANEIVAAVERRRGGHFPIDELLECKANGVRVIDATTFFERQACQIRVDFLKPSWLVFGRGFDQSFLRTTIKKTFDLIVSISLFIVALPIMLIAALFIFLEDRGPIFYQQERVGKGGKPFNVLKFRSMRKDAETKGTPQFAATRDPRVTRVGRILRALRIDELPQIINVLNGDMSFVGPRPERPFFVNQFCEEVPFYHVRHSVKPGITGFAQVRYQYGASTDDALKKLQYDLYYVKNNSLFLDIMILIDTFHVVVLGKGR